MASSVAMILAVTGVERRTVDLRVKIHGIHGECHRPHHGERDHLPMGAGLVPALERATDPEPSPAESLQHLTENSVGPWAP